jgi:IS5 family transposase
MFGSYSYQAIIERNQDHLLVRMSKLIDWSFVEEEVADYYSEKGQRAIHPARMFKLLVAQSLYNLSEREVCEQADCNILFRNFVGLGLADGIPHWTDLGKFKERIGVESFERLFYRVLDEAKRLGIEISNKRTADSTDIKANVDLKRCAQDKQGKDDHGWVDRNTTDKDADYGHKAKDKSWYGYKSHTNQDAEESSLVTSVITTKGSETDESKLIPLIDKEREAQGEDVIRQQGGDKGFIGHTEEMTERKILDYIIPRNNMKKDRAKKEKNNHYIHLRKLRYKVEQKFSEAKNQHGLGKARYRGIWKVHLGCLITYLAINLKRIVNLLSFQIA